MNFIKSMIGTYFNVLSIFLPKLAGKQSFFFFCFPFKAKLKPKQQEFLDTAKKKALIVEGKKVMTYSWGQGPKTVLFVHGWQSHSSRWKNYIDQIDKTKFRIIAFDAPGHGNSEERFSNVPLYEKAMKAVVTEFGTPNTIVSHSIGAFSTMYFIHKNKISLDRFVSLATPYTAIQFIHFYQTELKLSDRTVKHMKAYFDSYAGHPPEYYKLDEFAGSIGAKTLIIHDKGDKMTSVENSMALHKLLPDSKLVLTQGFGHGLRKQEVIERVLDYGLRG